MRLLVHMEVFLDHVPLSIERQHSFLVEANHDVFIACKIHTHAIRVVSDAPLAEQIDDGRPW